MCNAVLNVIFTAVFIIVATTTTTTSVGLDTGCDGKSLEGKACCSQIYCNSRLLEVMQLSRHFEDSKTFVDLPLRYNESLILEKFSKLPASPNKDTVTQFIEANFGKEGSELQTWTPTDFVERPKYIDAITDEEYKKFAVDLNLKWKSLGRKLDEDVKNNPHLYSSLYVPNGFVVPGGRFREFYYWDSYWVVRGLLVSGMTQTVKGMLENFLDMVDRFGFVPNGGRVYYLNRSQPPLLTPMVTEYYEKTKDLEFIRRNIHLLDKEYQFWERDRTVDVVVDGVTYKVNRYNVNNRYPRPESYREDLELGHDLPKTGSDFEKLMTDIASAAESGWDFSSRWYSQGGSTLNKTATSAKLPVDLNSFTCWNAHLLSSLHGALGNQSALSDYSDDWLRKMELIDAVFWDDTNGTWFDFDLETMSPDRRFFASMAAPLFTKCHGFSRTDRIIRESRFAHYTKDLFESDSQYKSGIPTSFVEGSGQQWDYPNAWPPLQHMWVYGSAGAINADLRYRARTLAAKWVRSNWNAWRPSKDMYEKYNALTGSGGSGGEYQVQLGFGWSNGVIIDLLKKYPDLKSAEDNSGPNPNASSPLAVTAAVPWVCTLMLHYVTSLWF